MGWKAKDVNTEETGKKHNLKICHPTTPVHVVGGNVPRDSFLLKLSFSDWISAHGHVKSGVSIVYQGGVLTRILNAAWWTVMWFPSVPVISFENCSKDAAPSPRNSVTNVWCNLINIQVLPKLVWKGGCEQFYGCMRSESELHQVFVCLWGVADQYFHQAVGK